MFLKTIGIVILGITGVGIATAFAVGVVVSTAAECAKEAFKGCD